MLKDNWTTNVQIVINRYDPWLKMLMIHERWSADHLMNKYARSNDSILNTGLME